MSNYHKIVKLAIFTGVVGASGKGTNVSNLGLIGGLGLAFCGRVPSLAVSTYVLVLAGVERAE